VYPVSSASEAPGSRALRVPLEGLAPGVRELEGEVARYIQRVHRLRPGARLHLFDPVLALEAEAELLEPTAGGVRCEITHVLPSGYRALPIVLLQALAKGEKPEISIREATALGVERIVFVESERVVVRLEPERRATRRTRWQRIAVEAARQCGRGNLPAIQGPLPLLDVLAQTTEAKRLLLSSAGAPLLARLDPWRADQALALLIGPEGGLSGSEAQSAQEHGFHAVSLGRTTLRTELAGLAALGAVVAFAAWRGIGGA
jgi:16S rRNA (uracil1498-N3)-methyltransferase